MSRQDAYFAQGYRCGHLEGKDRAGVYVLGEEVELAWEAASAQKLACVNYERAWELGYQFGYRASASGEALPSHIEHAPLPQECQ